jgi:ABC-type antimicrobial peptide transport system ATPase subunit
MNVNREQISLLKKIRKNSNNHKQKNINDKHRYFIFTFFKKHRFIVLGTFILLITQGTIETILIVVSRNQINNNTSNIGSYNFWQLFVILVILFTINSFFSIKQEKTIVVTFINELRHRIFRNYLGKLQDNMSLERQADLITKISYHLPLVSTGISNSFFGFIRWFIYLSSILIVSYLAGFNLLAISTFIIFLSIVIIIGSYFIVKKYIAQEVTFYSQIIRHVSLSLSEKYFSKSFNLEPAILKKFDTLVKFDSIFRIRRDLWLKMSFKIIFIVILVISILNHFFYNEVALKINLISPELKFLYLFLLIYLSRILNEALKIGLYFFPAKLGMLLTNVPVEKYFGRKDVLKIINEITFYSKKTKLFKTGRYYKNLNFNFLKNGRYLFYGTAASGKTTLAKMFAGNKCYTPKSIKVRLDNKRLDYITYQLKFTDVYFFDPNFYSQKSLIEVINGSDKEETSFSDIESTLKIIYKYPSLTNLVSTNNNFNAVATGIWSNSLKSFVVHALHCLVKKPSIILIDNLWLDLNYPEVSEILKLINQELPESIMIIFANKNNDILNYNHKYNFDEKFL